MMARKAPDGAFRGKSIVKVIGVNTGANIPGNLRITDTECAVSHDNHSQTIKTDSRVTQEILSPEYKAAQRLRVCDAFKVHPKTMREVETETGIRVANICRYVSELAKQCLIHVHHFGHCPISGASHFQFLTTDKRLFKPSIITPSLFD